jgi:hypothetical protein
MRPERRWRLDAHCRGEANEIFFPKLPAPRGEDPYAEARKLCAECSVTDECYELWLLAITTVSSVVCRQPNAGSGERQKASCLRSS